MADQDAHRAGAALPAGTGGRPGCTAAAAVAERVERGGVPRQQRAHRRDLRPAGSLRRLQHDLVLGDLRPAVPVADRLHPAAQLGPLQGTAHPAAGRTKAADPDAELRRGHRGPAGGPGPEGRHRTLQEVDRRGDRSRQGPGREVVLLRRARLHARGVQPGLPPVPGRCAGHHPHRTSGLLRRPGHRDRRHGVAELPVL